MAEEEAVSEDKEREDYRKALEGNKSLDTLKKILATVNPDKYFDSGNSSKKMAEFKKLVKNDYPAALKMAKGKALGSLKLTADAPTSSLEPIYFWLLDFMQDGGSKVEKLTDSFMSAPGSGHFGEMGMKVTKMQEEASKWLGAINQVVKSVLNLIYDLKEFELRLSQYDYAKSKNKEEKESGRLALKQIWLDQVDIKKGNTSIKALTFSNTSFATLLDAFMIVEDENISFKGQEIDLNDRVKRLLKQRIAEFNKWVEISEKELRKRFEIERAYLKSQVGTLKLYTSWARPYLKAANDLRMKGFDNDPALVSAFNTAMFELVLFGKSSFNFEKAVAGKKLPRGFISYKLKRGYNSINIVSLIFRGIPQRISQRGDYGFGGRVDVCFDAYVLNDEELKVFKKKWEDQFIADSLDFVQQASDLSLKELEEDISHFLDGDKKAEEKKKEKKSIENPFTALWDGLKDMFKSNTKKDKKNPKIGEIKKDDFVEKEVRKLAEQSALDSLYGIYDIYKKAHGMASSPESFDL